MKKIILSIAVVALSLTAINAQSTTTTTKSAASRETPETKAKTTVDKLSATVGLKPDQVTSVTKIFTDFFTKQQALRAQKSTLDEKALEAKRKELKDARNVALKAVLSADQWAKFQAEIKKEHADKGGQKRTK